MTTIVNFPGRKPKNTNAGPCRVVFHSTTFRDERGADKTVNVAVTIADGDFQGVIDAAREIGGIWGEQPDGVPFFLPWPCACVEVFPT